MILTPEQRMAAELGLDVDHHRGRQWPGGVMIFAIHPTLGKFSASLKNVSYDVIGHFTVVCLVTWPWIGSEAGGDLVLIQVSLLFICK